jgi:hypothetical protein
MALSPNLFVRLIPLQLDSKYFNVFPWSIRLRRIAFPRSKSGIFDLALNEIAYFWMDPV